MDEFHQNRLIFLPYMDVYHHFVIIFAYIAAIIIQESSIVAMNPCILVKNAKDFILIRKGTDSLIVKIDFSSL